MSYPSKVNVLVDGFGSTNGQDMVFNTGSNPPSYSKDSSATSEYLFVSLRGNSGGTDWELYVYHSGQTFDGSLDPAADDPVGDYADSGSQTAEVTDII